MYPHDLGLSTFQNHEAECTSGHSDSVYEIHYSNAGQAKTTHQERKCLVEELLCVAQCCTGRTLWKGNIEWSSDC